MATEAVCPSWSPPWLSGRRTLCRLTGPRLHRESLRDRVQWPRRSSPSGVNTGSSSFISDKSGVTARRTSLISDKSGVTMDRTSLISDKSGASSDKTSFITDKSGVTSVHPSFRGDLSHEPRAIFLRAFGASLPELSASVGADRPKRRLGERVAAWSRRSGDPAKRVFAWILCSEHPFRRADAWEFPSVYTGDVRAFVHFKSCPRLGRECDLTCTIAGPAPGWLLGRLTTRTRPSSQ
jgi:hypothetical protein